MPKNVYAKLAASIEKSEAKVNKMIADGRIRALSHRSKVHGKMTHERTQVADHVLVRPGPLPLADHRIRSYTVSVRLNSYEMSELDSQRMAVGAHFKRGEWMRMCWLRDRPKPPIPDTNWKVREHTARSAANLTQIAAILDHPEITAELKLAADSLERWRLSLTMPVNEDSTRDFVTPDLEKAKRHGPEILPADELRDLVVSIRLTHSEHSKLVRECGSSSKGEWIRMVWQAVETNGELKAVSKSAYESLIPSANNINKIALILNQSVKSESIETVLGQQMGLIKSELKAFIRNVAKAQESMK